RDPQGIGPRRCADRRPLQHGQPRSPSAVERAANSGRKTGAHAAAADIRKVEDIAPAFADATSQHVDVLIVSVDALTQKNRSFIAQLAAGHGVPANYVSTEGLIAGGLSG